MPVGHAEVGVVSGESQLNGWSFVRFEYQVLSAVFSSKDKKPASPALPERRIDAVQTAILPVPSITGSLPGRTSWTPRTNR